MNFRQSGILDRQMLRLSNGERAGRVAYKQYSTDSFTILEPKYQWIDEIYAVQKRRPHE